MFLKVYELSTEDKAGERTACSAPVIINTDAITHIQLLSDSDVGLFECLKPYAYCRIWLCDGRNFHVDKSNADYIFHYIGVSL